jgi:hypothetical protein
MVVKSGWPRTRFAGAFEEVGMEFQIRTRLLSVSATAKMVPSVATAVAAFKLPAALVA